MPCGVMEQDGDFLVEEAVHAIVIVSRVKQARPLKDRVEVWRRAVGEILRSARPQRLFELMDDGTLAPWSKR